MLSRIPSNFEADKLPITVFRWNQFPFSVSIAIKSDKGCKQSFTEEVESSYARNASFTVPSTFWCSKFFTLPKSQSFGKRDEKRSTNIGHTSILPTNYLPIKVSSLQLKDNLMIISLPVQFSNKRWILKSFLHMFLEPDYVQHLQHSSGTPQQVCKHSLSSSTFNKSPRTV